MSRLRQHQPFQELPRVRRWLPQSAHGGTEGTVTRISGYLLMLVADHCQEPEND